MYSCQTNILYWFLTWTCQETTMYSCQTNIVVPHLDLSGDYNVLMPNQYSGSSLGLVRRLQCTHAKPIYWSLTWTCRETTMYSCQTNILVPHLDLSGDYNVLMPNQYTGSSLGLVGRLQCTHAKSIYCAGSSLGLGRLQCTHAKSIYCTGSSLELVRRLQCTHAKPIYWSLTWTCQETTMYSYQTNILVPHLDLSGDYNVLVPNQYTGSSLGLVGRLQCTHAKPIKWFLTWTCQETTMYSCQTNIVVPHLDLSGDYNVLMPNQYSGSSLGLVRRLQCTYAKPIYCTGSSLGLVATYG